jgi:hypothetical protein
VEESNPYANAHASFRNWLASMTRTFH